MLRIFLIISLLITSILTADTRENITKQIKKYSNNIGFEKGDTREYLKNKFSMCDEFVKINWFKKQAHQKYQRGWLKYTTQEIKLDMKSLEYLPTGKIITVYEVATIKEDGNIEYKGLYFVKKAFKKTWKDVVKDMQIELIENSSKNEFTYHDKKYSSSKANYNMSDNYLNVCIVKPDNETALFVHNDMQMRQANKVLSDSEKELYLQKIKKGHL